MRGGFNEIYISNSYVQGTPLSGTGVFSGKTLADLGISPSPLISQWAIGSDFIEISASNQPPQSNSVPGPLPVLGAVAAFGSVRKLRQFSSALKQD